MPTRKSNSFITISPGGGQLFKNLRWLEGKKHCIRCDNTVIYTLSTGRLRCKICGLTFGDFTGTYLGQLNIPADEIAHLLYLFSLGLPVYRCRHYLTISMKTAHKAYTLFRRAIYDHSTRDFFDVLESKPRSRNSFLTQLTMDFNKSWEEEMHHVFFGIIDIDGTVYTFPITREEKARFITGNKYAHTRSALFCTDFGICIGELPVSGSHLVVSRAIHQKNNLKLNTKVQSFWTFLTDHLHNYQGISIPHYHLYIKDVEYRFNNRSKDIFHPMAKMLVQLVVKNEVIRSTEK